MGISTRTWWLGIAVLSAVLLMHAVFPRYEWQPVTGQPTAMLRVDRWTGTATWGVVQPSTGAWVPLAK